ncbi:CAMK family protein kinase [Tritrichomonas foetus]|uniref:non-specific serine/threonine protein kinase n=1 Tax=Tritrichomonas foetus TaxID=1144522 RepID=A0A1J4KE17_9EUKA|nr:CAMK family protein kinase [Tritrichomonas foetus]|eukprot:OHT09242.1 CAMK family protein kinase [Tritrichomonas foetus]
MFVSPGNLTDKYTLCHKIGSGAFGNVYKAIHKATNSEVAIKMIQKSTFQNIDAKVHFDNETKIMSKLDHPLISQFYEIIESGKDYICCVSEYARNGDLLGYLNSKSTLGEREARTIFSQLVVAVQYMHDVKKVAHRDLKPENILLDKDNNIRLIDFGFSKFFSDNQLFESVCGSPAYVAPEIVTGQKYTEIADIWSLGIILYAMVVGRLPFDGETLKEQLESVAYIEPHFPNHLSNELVDLLQKMLSKDPKLRIPLNRIISHPWLKGYEEVNQIFEIFKNPVFKFESDILTQMNFLGIDTKNLEQELIMNQVNDKTISYRLLQRNKFFREVSNLLSKNLSKPVVRIEVRQQFNCPISPFARTRNANQGVRNSTVNNLNQRQNKENDSTVENANSNVEKVLPPRRRSPFISPAHTGSKPVSSVPRGMMKDAGTKRTLATTNVSPRVIRF